MLTDSHTRLVRSHSDEQLRIPRPQRPGRPLRRDRAPLWRGRGGSPARLLPHPAYPGRARREQAVVAAARRALRPCARRHDRQPGHADGPRGPEGDLPVGLAGGGRQQYRLGHVSRPVAVSGQRRARAVSSHQPHPAARRPDRARRGRRPARLVRPHRRRRRGRLRRAAEQLRDHEGLH